MENDETIIPGVSYDELLKAIIESDMPIVYEGVPLQTDYSNEDGEHYININPKNYNEEVSFEEVPYKSRANEDVKEFNDNRSSLSMIEQVNNTVLKDSLIQLFDMAFHAHDITISFAYIGNGKAVLKFRRRDSGGEIKRSVILTDDDCVLSSGKCTDDYRAELEFPFNYIKSSYFDFMSYNFPEFKAKETNNQQNSSDSQVEERGL